MSVLQKITGTVYQTFDGEYLVKVADNLYVDMEGRLTIDLQGAFNNLSSGEWIEKVETDDQMDMKSIVAALEQAEIGDPIEDKFGQARKFLFCNTEHEEYEIYEEVDLPSVDEAVKHAAYLADQIQLNIEIYQLVSVEKPVITERKRATERGNNDC